MLQTLHFDVGKYSQRCFLIESREGVGRRVDCKYPLDKYEKFLTENTKTNTPKKDLGVKHERHGGKILW